MCDAVFLTFAGVFTGIWTLSLLAILIELDKMNRFLKYSIWMGIEQNEEDAESVDENEEEPEEPENDLKKDD